MSPVGNINNMQLPIKAYRKAKIRMLEKEFIIPLKQEEKEHFETLQNEIAIDNYARTLISRHWNKQYKIN